MPTFMCFLNWTEQGAKNAKDANKRYQASRSMAEKLGGKLLSAYVTTGQYDVVLTLEMPNGEAMAKFASAISGSGNARTIVGIRSSPRCAAVQQVVGYWKCCGPSAPLGRTAAIEPTADMPRNCASA